MTDREKKQWEILKKLVCIYDYMDCEVCSKSRNACGINQALSELSKLDAMPKEVEEAVVVVSAFKRLQDHDGGDMLSEYEQNQIDVLISIAKQQAVKPKEEVGVEEIKKFLDNPPEVENLMMWKCLDYGDIDRLAKSLLTNYSIRRGDEDK